MALGKDKTRIFKLGGGYLQLKELPSGSFLDLGYIKGSKIVEKREKDKRFDERGKHVKTFYGDTEAELQSVLMQATMEEINLLRTAQGKEFQLRYYCLREDGKYHLVEAAKCEIDPDLELNFDGTPREIPIVINLLYDETQESNWDMAETSSAPQEDDWPYST